MRGDDRITTKDYNDDDDVFPTVLQLIGGSLGRRVCHYCDQGSRRPWRLLAHQAIRDIGCGNTFVRVV
jgi:hypothetical protein